MRVEVKNMWARGGNHHRRDVLDSIQGINSLTEL